MERVEGLLFYASVEGNVTLLQILLQEDPLILDRVTVNRSDNMPVHVASMLGHFDFVNEILSRKPQLAGESDSQRRLPLHIASAKGHVEIVKALLSAYPETCLARDSDGRNPLHLAAIKGRYEVVKELLQAQPHAARAMVEQETILHLCVKHNQLEVLKLLVESLGDHEFVNSKDGDGNNILHLAVADKQIETINFLLLNTTIEVNASNTNRETSMDILAQGPKDVKDRQIIRSLTRADAVEPETEGLIEKIPQKWISKMSSDNKNLFPPISQKNREDWLYKKRDTLMVVASFIATMAFQVGTNPPSGVWHHPVLHHIFLISNTVGFLSTLSIILLLISGLHFSKHRGHVSTGIMIVIMWIATTSMSITYYVSITVTTPLHQAKTIRPLSVIIVFVWIGLMTLVVGRYMLLLMAITKKIIKLSYRRSPETTKNLNRSRFSVP
ncbi:ankyrin repeat-containing protein ITN1-like [Cynara cardunculus var. scolymus]|uniref:PGG domain-containing protein n=1 Tax=Cynara cardunculus var. scolymus TaxID=59895 RepID=A0A103XC24_CYNCS|nr:ankyrin repeat-containing protein ITN1-like [Cynara cardunculus var. scolymus]KVH87973.1 hypothetical protein Ccrd_024646 [Cynara cardunculus var. scolymus]